MNDLLAASSKFNVRRISPRVAAFFRSVTNGRSRGNDEATIHRAILAAGHNTLQDSPIRIREVCCCGGGQADLRVGMEK